MHEKACPMDEKPLYQEGGSAMKKPTKLWLIIAAFLILAGCMIFGGVMAVLQWDFTKLSTSKFEHNTHSISEPFHNISVKTDTAKLKFAPAQDGFFASLQPGVS